jgi:hypothetical protein
VTEIPSQYGRSESEWDDLTENGRRFLVEQARMGRTTTYTELNQVLVQRTDLPGFDFDSESERAAIGHLLYRIVEAELPESGHMISAIVIYLNQNDAGPGFYTYAEQLGRLPPRASADERLAFWSSEVAAVHDHYRARRR